MSELIRVQKLLAQAGIASRRKIEEYIEKGLVKINGIVAKLGDKADINDEIKFNNQIVTFNSTNFVYFLLNKPEKTITTVKDPKGRTTVVDLIDTNERIVPVGRLDYNTTGTLLLTNDLELVNKLTHPKYEIPRMYRARIDSPLNKRAFDKLNSEKGVLVNDKLSFQNVLQVDTKSYLIELHVGSYHHIKELFKAVKHEVINLKRVSYANLNVEKLPLGAYRKLTLKEIKDLKLIIANAEKQLEKKK
ncbi:ribosomal large subunit pseudouridine synthaseB [Mycoplasmopsis maculosa]|uniref:Ribosomal large subunit pseudouridine synthaseB n=1 Tax=Mycoplasmopsis maculosa TaxID=114885 RepID=A0A449B4E6_9BACT|nr:pseudouridine synthase [Mycoplasmopsis maculosa]VEU75449.1 ribosomal large subunit pseudouridine synthaseB [Mycoplasmopsis maculosa]